MIHHHENLPTKNVKQNTKLAEDLDERFLAEMLFYMEQMRRLIRKYDRVIKKYYVQFLSAHDVIDLKESIKVCNNFIYINKIRFLTVSQLKT
jgi:NCK-associated protein 1